MANHADVVAGAWRSFLFLAVAAAIPFALGARRLSPIVAGGALVGVVVADLWSVERLYANFSPRASQVYASDPGIEYLKQQPQPVRVIHEAFADGAAYHDPMLGMDGMMSHGIRVMLGYHGNEIRHWQTITGKARRYDQLMNPAIWGQANVQFIYTNVDSLGPDFPARRVVGPFRNAAGTQVSLYELNERNPYAWVVPLMAKYPDEAVAQAMRAPNFPYKSVALLDTASSTPTMPLNTIPAPLTIGTSVTAYAPGKATIELDAPAPAGSALLISESFYPGWTATVDGQPAKAERANLAFIGVALPAGARRVEIAFDSPPYHQGKKVTLIALALSVLALVVGLVADRRRTADA
jgi:hypothetical protein